MKVLLLNHSFRHLAGSEINALQLCEALRGMGHEAEIGTLEIGNPMRDLAAIRHIPVVDLLANENTEFDHDLIWAHHAPVLTHTLFRHRPGNCRLLFSSLSPLTALESPPTYATELSCILVHSLRNRDHLLHAGIAPNTLHYFPNHASAAFFDHPRNEPPACLRHIAVVSNHPPAEVRLMATKARRQGIRVDFIGGPKSSRYVDHATLRGYDLVISIGKTAQYCFAQRIPFYCYDRYGGPGYITPANLDRAEHGNFSGLAFRRTLGTDSLHRDIMDSYAAACTHLDYLREQASLRFSLERNMAALWPRIEALPTTDIAALRARHPFAGRLNDAHLDEFRYRLHNPAVTPVGPLKRIYRTARRIKRLFIGPRR